MGPATFLRSTVITIAMLAAASASAASDRDLTVSHRPARPVHFASSGPLNISLVPTSASVLRIGSEIGFTVGTTAGGYASLYVLSASGKVQLWMENVPIQAGHTMAYPMRGGIVRASPPAGDDQVLLVVTRTPFAGFSRGSVRSPLVLPYSHGSFRQALAAKTARFGSDDWASTELTIRIED